jgi:multiple sugar transport system substrate-binding protein
MFWGWNITGNWFLQALMWSQDKATMEGNAFQIFRRRSEVAGRP